MLTTAGVGMMKSTIPMPKKEKKLILTCRKCQLSLNVTVGTTLHIKTKSRLKDANEVETSDAKFEPGSPALGTKSGPAGLLLDLKRSCWGHAWLNTNTGSLVLRGYTAGLDRQV